MQNDLVHIYVDTNVLINYCTNQTNDVDVLNYIFSKRRREVLFTSSLAIVQTITNLQTKKPSRKPFTKQQIYKVLDLFNSKFTVIDLTNSDINNAKRENGDDVEDCVHSILAKKKKCVALLTNNVSDFNNFSELFILPMKLNYIKTLIK